MGKTNGGFVVVALISCFYLEFGTGADSITPSKSIKDSEAIISNGGVFRLGFFNLANSSNRYVGILYNQVQVQTVVWVANRNKPLKDFSGILNVSSDGNLVVINGNSEILWSSNVTNSAPNTTTAQLLDSGNLVLYNGDSNGVNLWESFQHPSNAFLQTMKISTDVKTGQKVEMRSWKSPDDPSEGNFSLSLEPFNIPECVVRNNDQLYFRTGPWNGHIFIGVITMNSVYLNGFYLVPDSGEKSYYFTFELSNTSLVLYYELDPQGQLIEHQWDDGKGEWVNALSILLNDCDIYGKCGAFGVCDSTKRPICSCLKGFEPRNVEEWHGGNWSGGCVRTTLLQCQNEGFLRLETMKVPAFPDWSSVTYGGCEDRCMKNCSCVAYAYDAGIGCMFWSGDLIDVQKFPFGGVDLYIRLPSSELDQEKHKSKVIVIATVIPGAVGITIFALCLRCWMAKKRGSKQNAEQKHNKGNAMARFSGKDVGENSIQVKLQQQLPHFEFEELATATNNFHHTKKLGEGGFGPVYRVKTVAFSSRSMASQMTFLFVPLWTVQGTLDDGKEIAVKRLSKASGQGMEEFMNEVVVISKLQHRNLVRLLGCCIEGEEKMLVYEYMPNKSLDAFLFDPDKQKLLDWRKRFNIIEGISRGLLYLHRDSRLKIIHRDLKTSNVLLDEELNPKISDFGMARIFGGNENQANTKRVVGTYGYMSPEYAMQGQFSEKSDVFSFGVLLLEIVSGKKNTGFYNDENHLSLLGYAWQLWKEGDIPGLVDKVVLDSDSDSECEKEIRRCIHVGLLCVQEHAKDRPTMSTVVSMLNSEISDLDPPRQPAFTQTPLGSQDVEDKFSFNDVTLTEIGGR